MPVTVTVYACAPVALDQAGAFVSQDAPVTTTTTANTRTRKWSAMDATQASRERYLARQRRAQPKPKRKRYRKVRQKAYQERQLPLSWLLSVYGRSNEPKAETMRSNAPSPSRNTHGPKRWQNI